MTPCYGLRAQKDKLLNPSKPIEENSSSVGFIFFEVFSAKRQIGLQWIVRKPLGLEDPP